MPYKSEKIIIAKSEFDKRIKLSESDKEEIKRLSSEYSQRYLAKIFGVSRRTIVFTIYPERLVENKKRRIERGGSKQYYDREKQRDYIKTHRRYKQELFINNKIKND